MKVYRQMRRNHLRSPGQFKHEGKLEPPGLSRLFQRKVDTALHLHHHFDTLLLRQT